jgi:hypothetical protein
MIIELMKKGIVIVALAAICNVVSAHPRHPHRPIAKPVVTTVVVKKHKPVIVEKKVVVVAPKEVVVVRPHKLKAVRPLRHVKNNR